MTCKKCDQQMLELGGAVQWCPWCGTVLYCDKWTTPLVVDQLAELVRVGTWLIGSESHNKQPTQGG